MGWGEELSAACDAQSQRLHQIANESSIQVVRFIRDRTPVDTTNAQNSWFLSPGRETYVQFNGRAVGRDPVSEARAILNNNKNTKIYITNSEDYILNLEWGSSRQAPSGFMQQTTDAWPTLVTQTAKSIKAKGWK